MDQQRFRLEDVTSDLARLRIGFVNVYFAGAPGTKGDGTWTLIDAGVSVGATRIFEAAAARFGAESRPAAIVLTHGHFDHVGALDALLRVWDVPVYAHTLELPFLTGRADYPPPDMSMAGALTSVAPLFPERRIDLGGRVRALPWSGEVPTMPGWRWVHTPGHAPGHVSFFRDADRTLIVGDAVSTTPTEATFSVMTQDEQLSGPPAAFTIDWENARRSVETIALLKPTLLAPGHGDTIRRGALPEELTDLARNFESRARPGHGRYVVKPAVTDEDGVMTLPNRARSSGVKWGALTGVAAAAFAGTWLYRRFGKRTNTPQ